MASQLVPKRKPWLISVALAIAATIGLPKEARSISCVTGPFIVFFDLDDDNLTGNATAILDNVIARRNMCGHDGRLAIMGYADRSGPSRHNLSLAWRRAERVRAYASTHGVPDEMMTVKAEGEENPLVVTPDGVQEPQNRRVEISYPPPEGW